MLFHHYFIDISDYFGNPEGGGKSAICGTPSSFEAILRDSASFFG
jgi:hypothetical protein